jgi:hypothetical protein
MYCGGELPALMAAHEAAEPALDPAALALLAKLERSSSQRKPTRPSPGRPELVRDRTTTPTRPTRPTKPKKDKKKSGPSAIESTTINDAPPSPKTYAEALTRGGGPFGNRDAAARVILIPSPDYRPKIQWLKHRLAATLGIDLYTAVQALQRDVPRGLAAFRRVAEAEKAVAHLREAGLTVGILRRDRILAWPGPQEVLAFTRREETSVTFRLKEGGEIEVDRTAFRLAILGRIDPDPAERKTGGLLGRSGGPYTVVDLLVKDSDRPLRVRSDAFDFRSMGEAVGISALVNVKRLAADLAPAGRPRLALDQRFKRVPHFAAMARASDATEPPLFLRRELEFAEYGLVLALA